MYINQSINQSTQKPKEYSPSHHSMAMVGCLLLCAAALLRWCCFTLKHAKRHLVYSSCQE